MRRHLSLATRRELIEVVRERYRKATGENRQRLLDEFVAVTGYHRKHAIRLFGEKTKAEKRAGGTAKRIYDEALQQALIVLWEAADRICGKRLKPLIPILVEAMERHGHLQLDAEVRKSLLAVSAATIDRLLRKVRESAIEGKRKRGVATACAGASRYERLPTGMIRRPAIWRRIWWPTAAGRWQEV